WNRSSDSVRTGTGNQHAFASGDRRAHEADPREGPVRRVSGVRSLTRHEPAAAHARRHRFTLAARRVRGIDAAGFIARRELGEGGRHEHRGAPLAAEAYIA